MGLISYFSLDDDDYDSDDDDEQKYIRHDTEILNSDTFTAICKMVERFQKFHVSAIVCYKQPFFGKALESMMQAPPF